MRRLPLHALFPVLALSFAFLQAPLSAQQASSARAAGLSVTATSPADSAGAPILLSLEHYAGWKRITSTEISPDGRWMSYGHAPNDGVDSLFLKELDGERMHRMARGTQPSFSADSRWALFQVAPEPARGAGAAAAAGRSASGTTVTRWIELATGKEESTTGIERARFSDDARWLVLQRNRASSDAAHRGADLLLRDLRSGVTRHIGNVTGHAFDRTERYLAYTVDAPDQVGNGVVLLDLRTDRQRILDTGRHTYSELSWNEAGTVLAFLRGSTPEGMEQRENILLVAALAGNDIDITRFDPPVAADFPAGFVLSEFGGVRWNDDGSRIFLGIKEQRSEGPKDPGNGGRNVDVWHWADETAQSVQGRRATQALRFTWSASYDVRRKTLTRLADGEMRDVTLPGKGKFGIGRDARAYSHIPQWGGQIADYFRVDLDSGARTPIVEGLVRQMGISPDGRYFLYFKDETLIAYEMATGRSIDVSARAPVSFTNAQHSHPNEVGTYGLVGWSTDGRSLILNHRYDLWRVPVEGRGEAVNLTRGIGEERQIVFRIVREGRPSFGPGAGTGSRDDGIDLSRPLLLSAYGDRTKENGYWRLPAGRAPSPLHFGAERLGNLVRADSADRVLFTRQTFTTFPDYWVSDGTLQNPRQVTDANPQLSDFAWSPGRVLIDYTNERGNQLQGTLALPYGYEPGKRYPMLVYFYETMSQQHHNFQMPRYDDRPHVATYASQGYLVLQPDIVYTMGRPGSSALDDLTSSVAKVVELGYADPARIGLQGHSWGGYQSSFVVTQTDLFAAVVTGAPPTNLVSFYGELYASSGSVQQGITEAGQVRMGMGVTPWTDPELYRSQSPLHNVQGITTPFLILHGTDDGAVDWRQGLEFYNAARRNGKEVIFLSYPGEAHHLNRRANQEDFQVRMKQFFDHYLMDAPAPRWMTEGVPFIDKHRANPVDGASHVPASVEEDGVGRP